MKIRTVVFEFIASRQTDRQTDRRGEGLCFIICIDKNWQKCIRFGYDRLAVKRIEKVTGNLDITHFDKLKQQETTIPS